MGIVNPFDRTDKTLRVVPSKNCRKTRELRRGEPTGGETADIRGCCPNCEEVSAGVIKEFEAGKKRRSEGDGCAVVSTDSALHEDLTFIGLKKLGLHLQRETRRRRTQNYGG